MQDLETMDKLFSRIADLEYQIRGMLSLEERIARLESLNKIDVSLRNKLGESVQERLTILDTRRSDVNLANWNLEKRSMLSPKQALILDHLLQTNGTGSNQEIADKLEITEKTVRHHLRNATKRLNEQGNNIKNRRQLMLWALLPLSK